MIPVGSIALDLDAERLSEPGIQWAGAEISATAVSEQASKASRELKAASELQARLAEGAESGPRWCDSAWTTHSGLVISASRGPPGSRAAATALAEIRSLPEDERDVALARFTWSLATGTLRALIDIHELGAHHGELEGEAALRDRIMVVPGVDGQFRILLQHPKGTYAALANNRRAAPLWSREHGDANRLAELLAAIIEGRDLIEASHAVSPKRLEELFGPGADRWNRYLTEAERNPIDPDADFLRSMLSLLEPAVATAIKRVPPPTLTEQVEVQSKVVARSWAVRGTAAVGVLAILGFFGIPLAKRLLRPDQPLVIERWSAEREDDVPPEEGQPLFVTVRRQAGHDEVPLPPRIYAFEGTNLLTLTRRWGNDDENVATYKGDALPEKRKDYDLEFFADDARQRPLPFGKETSNTVRADDDTPERIPDQDFLKITDLGDITCRFAETDPDSGPDPPVVSLRLGTGETSEPVSLNLGTPKTEGTVHSYSGTGRLPSKADNPAWGKELVWVVRDKEVRKIQAPPFPLSIETRNAGTSEKNLEDETYLLAFESRKTSVVDAPTGSGPQLILRGPEGLRLVDWEAKVGNGDSRWMRLEPGTKQRLLDPQLGPENETDVHFRATVVRESDEERAFALKTLKLGPKDDPWEFVDASIRAESLDDGRTKVTVDATIKDPEGKPMPDSMFVRVEWEGGSLDLPKDSCESTAVGHRCTFTGSRSFSEDRSLRPKLRLFVKDGDQELPQAEIDAPTEIRVTTAKQPDPQPQPPRGWSIPALVLKENQRATFEVRPNEWKDTARWKWTVGYPKELAELEPDRFKTIDRTLGSDEAVDGVLKFELTPPEWYEDYRVTIELTAISEREISWFASSQLNVQCENREPDLEVSDAQGRPVSSPMTVTSDTPLVIQARVSDPDAFASDPQSLFEWSCEATKGPFRVDEIPPDGGDALTRSWRVSATGPGEGQVDVRYGTKSVPVNLRPPESEVKPPSVAGFELANPQDRVWLMREVNFAQSAPNFRKGQSCQGQRVDGVVKAVQSALGDAYTVRLPSRDEASRWDILPSPPPIEDALTMAIDKDFLDESLKSPRSLTATIVADVAGLVGRTPQDLADRAGQLKKPDAIFLIDSDGNRRIFGSPDVKDGKVDSPDELRSFIEQVKAPEWPGGPWPTGKGWPDRATLHLVIEPR